MWNTLKVVCCQLVPMAATCELYSVCGALFQTLESIVVDNEVI